jgi:hypothetical protein
LERASKRLVLGVKRAVKKIGKLPEEKHLKIILENLKM